ncbi:MAG: VIT1/CCC1 transporter family protein [Acidimicrobiia bacterium]|nr:VIT1/CCC1 transporter family protein [Acidimicrobiia bacterium]MDH4306232.1 VIT1/CCC1 transporter family protein [Acidimicrobiia bacterium]MDH5293198.1 VIT1/CCC1 transporter family protein [Acidimicrobiia bacterium]
MPGDAMTYEPHIGDTRQYWRDIVLGVNDGLVSMLLLVAGVVGGGLNAGQVLLTGVAGAIAGAVSMAAGEYLATKSQEEVLDSELELERIHIRDHREMELDQLRGIFADMGVAAADLDGIVAAFDRSDSALLNAMKALEFGVVDSERRSPIKAMVFSGLLFMAGSLPSVVPFAVTTDTRTGLIWAAGLAAIGLFLVGVAKARVTRGNFATAGLENMAIAGLGGIVAYFVGDLVGAQLV